jgi:hypothetical protein
MMSQQRSSLQSFARLGLAIAAILSLSACGDAKSAAESRVYQMGERVDVGGVVYTILETEWRASIGDGPDQMVPKNRFLIIRATITNGTGSQANLPFLTLEDAKGNSIMEEQNAKALTGWLGMLRMIAPAQTEEGKMVFDVAPGNYKLRVAGGTGENEVTRLVEIPYNIADNPVKTN